jgi:hypothetical protein
MSDLKILFHLTANGWHESHRLEADQLNGVLPLPPDGTLAIYELHIQRGSGLTKDRRMWAEVWRSAEATSADILRAKMLHARPEEDAPPQ